jgi:DNA-binding CsgD family transcriptional regulator
MLCPRCARDNRVEARFCDACGHRLAEAPANEIAGGAAFVGRESEFAVLTELLARSVAGRGGMAALVGEPGIGKTHTAQALARHAAAGGMRVLWGRCNEAPGAPPYWPWLQILRAWLDGHDDEDLRRVLGTAAGPLAGIVPEIGQRLSGLAPLLPTVDPLQQRFRMFDAMAGFWKRAAAQAPLLLILDNLHWADASSLRLLEFLVPELEDARLLLLGTYRDIELDRQHPLSATLGDLARYGHFRRLRLAGLNRDETARLIARSGGGGLTPALLDVLHGQTEGNPLFIAEMTRLLVQDAVLGPAARAASAAKAVMPHRIPEGVKEVIGRRLNRLSAAANHVLARAALIGRAFDLGLLQRVLDRPAAQACHAVIEEALQAHVIETAELPGRYQFSHALIRETLYEEIAAPTRGRLHLQAALAIEALHAHDLERHLPALAYHYGAALPGGDAARAAEVARRAAERATLLLAHEEAARYYRLALQAIDHRGAGDPAPLSPLLNALGESLTMAGEYLQAREAFEQAVAQARADGAADQLARAALGFETASWAPGLPGLSAARLLRAALDALDGQGLNDSTLKAQLLSSLARALVFSGEDGQAAIVQAQAVAMARRRGDTPTLVATLLATVSARWQPERSAERLRSIEEARRLAERDGDVLRVLDADAWHLFELMELGDLSGWLARLERYERLGTELRQPFLRYVAATSRATWALLQGRFAEAETLIEQALQIGRRMPGLDAPGVYGMQMFALRSEQGGLRALAPLVRHFVATVPRGGIWRPGLALIYAEIGQLDEARIEFDALAADDFAAIGRDGLRAASLSYLAQVCARLGDAPRAAVLYRLLLPHDGRNLLVGTTVGCLGAAASVLGLLATTRRLWRDAERHFESALALNQRQQAAPALAHTRYRYALMRRARDGAGDREAARALLDQAGAEAGRMGMRALAAQIASARREIDAVPQPPAYPAGLSAREAQVLRLVASGRGNREIAQQLFVSSNTVANHVRAILAKTGCANRTEAAAFAIRSGITQA